MNLYKRKKISYNLGLKIAKKQDFKCNKIFGYDCLLWKYNDGQFDEAGYQIDHIDEFCLTGNNDISNLQALCPNCHAVKTKRFLKKKRKFTTEQINMGSEEMIICD